MAKIIAELCQNHNGDKNLLNEMIWAASESGADFVKIQSINAEDLTFRERFENGVVENGIQKVIKRPYRSEYERLKKLELSDKDHWFFIEQCQKAGVIPLTTCFTKNSVEYLSKFPWKTIKIASYDCGSIPLIKLISEKFEHLIISTGATFDNEIESTVNYLNSINKKFTLLHCITVYPTPLNETNLNRINYLKKLSPDVGFSDHSLVEKDGIKASIAALAFGADIIERHFTILKKDESKDGPVSINPQLLKELSEFAKMKLMDLRILVNELVPEFKQMFGEEFRELSQIELLNRDYYRGRFASVNNGKYTYNWEED
ncbi:MAG TPA: general stress protein [Bacteroidetes bacterium]|nr:general stress protein [Bacteroidota bacterium]HCN37054.1 general stress protein [Bacteroidota bacterium]